MFEHFGQDLILLDRLASGGMGEVYRAKQLGKAGFDKTVAVKMILPHYAALPEFKTMFEQEMRLCARLQHPNLAQVFSTGEWNGYLYLVMEFIDGRTVRDLIQGCKEKKQKIPTELICLICSEVAKGLSYAHTLKNETTGEALNLVHRDISPQNIMIGFNGEVKILDFGVAKAADSMDLTRPGDLKGNLAYVSPEAIESLPLDGRSDLFSLGAIAHEMITLVKLFAGNSTFDTINKVRFNEVPRLKEIAPEIPDEVELIIMNALAKNREQRYQSAESLHRDLSSLLSSKYPKLVSSDLGAYLNQLFQEERKQEIERRNNANSLWSQKSQNAGQTTTPRSASGSSYNTYQGAKGSFLEETVVGSPTHSIQIKESQTTIKTWLLGFIILIITCFIFWPDIKNLAKGSLIADFQTLSLNNQRKVAKWISSSDSHQIAQQYDENKQPSLINSNGKNLLQFDGQDDYLNLDSVARSLNDKKSFTITMVLRTNLIAKQNLWGIYLKDRNTDLVRLFIDKEGRINAKCIEENGKGYIPSSPQDLSKLSILTTVVHEDHLEVFLNSKSIISAPILNHLRYQDATFLSVGQDFDHNVNTDFFNGELGDFTVVAKALNSEDRLDLEKKLASKFDINLAN